MSSRLNSNSKYSIARDGFIDENSLNFMKINLERRFGDSNKPKLTPSSSKVNSGSKWFQTTTKTTEKSSQNLHEELKLNIGKARRAPLPKLPVTTPPESFVIELSPEHLKIPTKEELEERRRSGMVRKELVNKGNVSQRYIPMNAPAIPKPPSESTSRKRLEEFKRKIKGIKLDSVKGKEYNVKPMSQRKISVLKEMGGSCSSDSTPPLHQSNEISVTSVLMPIPQALNSVNSMNIIRDIPQPSGDTGFDFNDFINKSNESEESLISASLLRFKENRKNRNYRTTNCIICDLEMDTMYSLENFERLILLRCDHLAHEQCLTMEVELHNSLNSDPDQDKEMFFPKCLICKETAFPVDPNDVNTIFSTAIFNKLNIEGCGEASPLSATLEINESKFMHEMTPTEEENHPATPINDELKLKNVEPLIIPSKSPKRPRPGIVKQHITVDITEEHHLSQTKTHSRRRPQGSNVPAIPLVVTSAAEYKIPPSLKNTNNWTNKFSIHSISNKFTADLIRLSQDDIIKPREMANFITMLTTLETFGEVRIADKMMVRGANNTEFIEYYCFLFSSAILFVDFESMAFTTMSISYLTNCELDDDDILNIKPTRRAEIIWQLDSQMDYLTRKWEVALTVPWLYFDNSVITNTITENEFDHLLGSRSTNKEECQYKKLLTGVDPRFYNSIINDVNIIHKPDRIVLILNQFPYSATTTFTMKNIIQALHIIRINIDLILTCSKFIKIDSCIVSHHELLGSDGEAKLKPFLEIIDDFEYNFYEEDDYDFNINTLEKTILDIIHNNKNTSIEDIHNILLSNTTLNNIGQLPTRKNIMIEIGLLSENKSFKSNIVDLADWDDVMEVICSFCSLEFDESDFELSDVDSSGFDILGSNVSLNASNEEVKYDDKELISSKTSLHDDRTMSLRLSPSQIQIDSSTIKQNLLNNDEENGSSQRLGEIIGRLDMELEKYSGSL